MVIISEFEINEYELTANLSDGRTLSVPLIWYPRLFSSTIEERNNLRLVGKGEGIYWSDLDEDISVENLILGKASGESQNSLKKWKEKRS